MHRRAFMTGATAGLIGGGALGWATHYLQRPQSAARQAPLVSAPGSSGLPGPYPGRVVEVNHPGAIHQTKRNREVVKALIARGMRELVGSDDAAQAWRSMFSRGDRVGIKVVPVGRPDSISSHEVVQEIIAGLVSAGVRPGDILVFDRYKDEFMACNYHTILPDGVHWECESAKYDDLQVDIDGQMPGLPREARVSGYDPDVYRELAYCSPGHSPDDDRRFRSHLSKIISRKVDKFISIPVLKDHRSAGVTLALKNLSHGSVNNVARSHISRWNPLGGQPYFHGATLNQCGTFIPAIVSLPPVRQKAVLEILDGLLGTWEGGPGTWNKTFATWEYKSLFFATDPVALDHIGWRIIDAKRADEGWAPVARMGLEGVSRTVEIKGVPCPSEQFQMRQPEHISLAATLGLGVFDHDKIDHRRINLS